MDRDETPVTITLPAWAVEALWRVARRTAATLRISSARKHFQPAPGAIDVSLARATKLDEAADLLERYLPDNVLAQAQQKRAAAGR